MIAIEIPDTGKIAMETDTEQRKKIWQTYFLRKIRDYNNKQAEKDGTLLATVAALHRHFGSNLITQPSISNWRNGKSVPSKKSCAIIAEALNLNIREVFAAAGYVSDDPDFTERLADLQSFVFYHKDIFQSDRATLMRYLEEASNLELLFGRDDRLIRTLLQVTLGYDAPPIEQIAIVAALMRAREHIHETGYKEAEET